MAQVKIETGYRVVIEPLSLGDFGFAKVSDQMAVPDAKKRLAAYKRRCEDIAQQASRHVEDAGSAYVEITEEAVCEHCGSAWTEKNMFYNNGCCDKDEELV